MAQTVTQGGLAELKETVAGGQLPSLKDIVASGQVPKANIPNAKATLDYGDKPLFDDMKRVLADGFFTQEEADALPWDLNKMQSVLNNMPRRNGMYLGPGAYIANTLQNAIERKKKVRDYEEAMAQLAREGQAAKEAKEKEKRAQAARQRKESGEVVDIVEEG